jgi:flagellar hook-basal body complex protein FliE
MIEALSLLGGVTASLRPAAPAAGEAPSKSFGAVLGELVGSVSGSLKAGETAAMGAVTGAVPLQTAVESIMQAERTLTATIAVRDKALAAWSEISRMQI